MIRMRAEKKIDDFEDKKSDQIGYESDGVFVFPTFAT